MRDLIITAKQKIKELRILLCSFIVAFLLNIIAIIIYKTPWVEIFTQFGYILSVTIVLYLSFFLIRLIFFLLKSLFGRTK